MNMVGIIALALGIYLVYRADQEKKNEVARAFFLITGLIAIAWSLPLFSTGTSPRVGAPLLGFAFFSVATVKTKGATQLISGFVAFVILLAVLI